ncbi:transcription regulator hth lysr [Lucifera butyrica]|uniref:Transcription regulator hth lysr n=1 Tax=Lucifera butyrica TaxID=1351585 RepID=A0A498RD42_9FIRM|nr:LysR family transcriptional regulator [Lucifera butyrica]VBB09371.1 transcription regulator hth lysr [Lucifera butyrica]
MELRELEYFVTVAELKNFTAAAERLHISQPAISKAVHKLEEELGFHLIDRNQKSVFLTEEGTVFFNLARGILKQVAMAKDTMEEYKNLTKGTFRIAVPPILGAYIFPQLFAAFKSKYPFLEMQVLEDGSSTSVNRVKNEEVHVGLVILPPDLLELHLHRITSQKIVVCLPAGHFLSSASALTFEQIKNEPVILYNEGFVLREVILNEYARYKAKPNVVISTNQFQTIKALVSKGVGISFLPANSIVESRQLIKIPLAPDLFLDMGLIWKPNKTLPLAGRAFIEFVKNYSYDAPSS